MLEELKVLLSNQWGPISWSTIAPDSKKLLFTIKERAQSHHHLEDSLSMRKTSNGSEFKVLLKCTMIKNKLLESALQRLKRRMKSPTTFYKSLWITISTIKVSFQRRSSRVFQPVPINQKLEILSPRKRISN